MKLYILLFFTFFLSYSHLNELYAQKNEGDSVVIFIKDLSAKDYYSLVSADPDLRKFEVIESCIPKGFLLIKYPNKTDLKKEMDQSQQVVLKITGKAANFTAYTVGQMHQLCTDYRKDISDD